MSTTATIWASVSYQSGTQTVMRNAPGAWYHVGHLAADTEGDGGRFDVARELADWLNGGAEPWWLDLLQRTTPDAVTLPHGCEIRATGPMIDRATPPSWGDWIEDESADARIARGLLIDAFFNRKRLE